MAQNLPSRQYMLMSQVRRGGVNKQVEGKIQTPGWGICSQDYPLGLYIILPLSHLCRAHTGMIGLFKTGHEVEARSEEEVIYMASYL